MKTIDYPSPNSAPRPAGTAVDVLVLHYTELPLQDSLDILCDPARAHRVSSHYVLAEDGTLYRLVPEDRVAWHAGRSYWRGREALNTTSIGVEIVNLHGDRHDYPPRQIEALIMICRGIVERHPAIEPRNVVGHSDIAPKRKIDPGLRFPWRHLADNGIGLWPRAGVAPIEGDIQAALQHYGYTPPAEIGPVEVGPVEFGPAEVGLTEIVSSFQRHFRPACVDGVADDETRSLLAGLLDRAGAGP